MSGGGAVARLEGVTHRYGRVRALDAVTLECPAGAMIGVISPDGVGKSSLLALIAGARRVQSGTVRGLSGDMADPRHRESVCARIAYIPQGLGNNLYADLCVRENIEFRTAGQRFVSFRAGGSAQRCRRARHWNGGSSNTRGDKGNLALEMPQGDLRVTGALLVCCGGELGIDGLARAQSPSSWRWHIGKVRNAGPGPDSSR